MMPLEVLGSCWVWGWVGGVGVLMQGDTVLHLLLTYCCCLCMVAACWLHWGCQALEESVVQMQICAFLAWCLLVAVLLGLVAALDSIGMAHFKTSRHGGFVGNSVFLGDVLRCRQHRAVVTTCSSTVQCRGHTCTVSTCAMHHLCRGQCSTHAMMACTVWGVDRLVHHKLCCLLGAACVVIMTMKVRLPE